MAPSNSGIVWTGTSNSPAQMRGCRSVEVDQVGSEVHVQSPRAFDLPGTASFMVQWCGA